MMINRITFLLTIVVTLLLPPSLHAQDGGDEWQMRILKKGISATMPGYPSSMTVGDITFTMSEYQSGSFLITSMPAFAKGNHAIDSIRKWVEVQFSTDKRIKINIKKIPDLCGFPTMQILTECLNDSGKVSEKMEMRLICGDSAFSYAAVIAPPEIYDNLSSARSRFFDSVKCGALEPKTQPTAWNQLILWIGLPVLVIVWLILRKRFSRPQEE